MSPLEPDFNLSVNRPPNLPDIRDCTTQRQVDTEVARKAFVDFAEEFPAAGEVLASLGDKALHLLVDRILLALHPRATSTYGDINRTLYDLPFGMSI